MAESSRTERIDLTRAEDPRDVVHRAVACLAQGGLVGLPTDTGYALAAGALHPSAVSQLADLGISGGGGSPLHLAVRGAEELADWLPGTSRVGRRLTQRSWPGPVVLTGDDGGRGLAARLPPGVNRSVSPGGLLSLRCPDHPAALDILQLVPGPLVLLEALPGTTAAIASPEEIAGLGALDMLLDDGPFPAGPGATLVRVEADSWKVERPGAIDEAELSRRAGVVLLFVCTGNTCRSPMAEALCRDRLAARLGCRPEEVAGRGYVVLSAGVGAHGGQPAAAEAVEIIRDRGGSLRHHLSRRISPELIRQADRIIAMTRGHRDALLSYFPEAADRVRLLDPSGGDVDDPIGCDLATYRHTADQIEGHLEDLFRELGL